LACPNLTESCSHTARRSRLSEWLALHLSNFSFHWPWDRWAHVAELPAHAPQRVFVEETLLREIRLSYWDRIHSTLPEEMQKLMPPKPEAQSRYAAAVAADGGVEGSEVALAQELMGMMKRKLSVVELEGWVTEALVGKVEADVTVRVVGTCVLILCSKSWTHLVTLLERFGSLLRQVRRAHSDRDRWGEAT
jgi:nuclear cap-binding protein subunit 1